MGPGRAGRMPVASAHGAAHGRARFRDRRSQGNPRDSKTGSAGAAGSAGLDPGTSDLSSWGNSDSATRYQAVGVRSAWWA